MDGCARLQNYVNEVLTDTGNYPLTIQQACQRFVDDMDRDDFYFDIEAANQAIQNVELLPHTKGEWQGRPTILEPWQCFWVGSLFGWKWTKNNLRRFRYAFVLVPRKNGKTHIVLCIALLMLGPDMERGAEVFLGATSQDHCRKLLYKPIKYMVDHCEDYREEYGVEVGATSMICPDSNSSLQTVIKKPDDGDSPHCAIVDEYHEHDTPDQYETFDTGMGARRQPLLHAISTSGDDLGGPCKSEYDQCKSILNGETEGDSTFALIYEINEGDDWQDEKNLAKANPNLGVSVFQDYLVDQLKIAKRSTDKQNAFRTKHLNQWVGSRVAWMNMVLWQRQNRKALVLEDFSGMECHIGCDLASKIDLAALYIMFQDGENFYGFPFLFAPEEAAKENQRYAKYANRGEIQLTPGNMTDYAFIENKIKDLAAIYQVKSIAFDPFQAAYLITRLAHEKLPVMEFGQTAGNMSEPMKEIQGLVKDGRFWHDGNQAMTWMVGNTTAKTNAQENTTPVKNNRNDKHCKIDGAVAMIMAMGRCLRDAPTGPSIYETRGIRRV